MKIRKTNAIIGDDITGVSFVDMTPYEYADEMAVFVAPRLFGLLTDIESIEEFGLEVCDRLTAEQRDELLSLFVDRLRYRLMDGARESLDRVDEKLDGPEFTHIISDLQDCV